MIGWKMSLLLLLFFSSCLRAMEEDGRLLEREHVFILFHEIEDRNLPLNRHPRKRSCIYHWGEEAE